MDPLPCQDMERTEALPWRVAANHAWDAILLIAPLTPLLPRPSC